MLKKYNKYYTNYLSEDIIPDDLFNEITPYLSTTDSMTLKLVGRRQRKLALNYIKKIKIIVNKRNYLTLYKIFDYLLGLHELEIEVTEDTYFDIYWILKLLNLRILTINGIVRNISLLEKFKRLTHLSLTNSNINNLSNLEQLKELSLHNTSIKNYSFLLNLTNLESLVVFDEEHFTLIPVLPKLKVLSLANLSNLHNFNNLRELNNLEELYLHFCLLTFIPLLSKLKVLSLTNVPITEFEQLNNLTTLEKFNLYESNLTFIPNLSSLKHLQLGNVHSILDYTTINNLINLETIQFEKTGINFIPLLPLLKKIYLMNNHNITQQMVNTFKKTNPGVYIYFDET